MGTIYNNGLSSPSLDDTGVLTHSCFKGLKACATNLLLGFKEHEKGKWAQVWTIGGMTHVFQLFSPSKILRSFMHCGQRRCSYGGRKSWCCSLDVSAAAFTGVWGSKSLWSSGKRLCNDSPVEQRWCGCACQRISTPHHLAHTPLSLWDGHLHQ